jgi:hypothetical protein
VTSHDASFSQKGELHEMPRTFNNFKHLIFARTIYGHTTWMKAANTTDSKDRLNACHLRNFLAEQNQSAAAGKPLC